MASRQPELSGPASISQLARRFSLTRSTLLHSDRIGLLQAEARSAAGYRRYGPDAQKTLARIVELRAAGLPLKDIRATLEATTPLAQLLEQQVAALNRQIDMLRRQQTVALNLLSWPQAKQRRVNKAQWTQMFMDLGLDDAAMHRWHRNFEISLPEAHREFLASLGLDASEIETIRAWSSDAG